jgi:membrane protein
VRAELSYLARQSRSRQHIEDGLAAIADEFGKHDLLTYSSAIAFQALYVVVPLTLLALAALGLVGLQSVYTAHIAPTLRHDLSPDGYQLANGTAQRVMNVKRVWWTTAGLAVTVWGMGASMRAMMTPLNRIYDARETRSYRRRLVTSILVGALVMLFVFTAIGLMLAGRLVHPGGALAAGFAIVRWGVTLALVLAALAALIRFVPATRRPLGWVSVGTVLAAVCWIVATVGYAAYISTVSYASFYGALAGIVLLLVYLHVAAIAFLLGVVVDSRLRGAVENL